MSHNDYTYALKGSGNISGTGDNFFFLSDLHYGNGQLAAQLTELEDTHANARAGIMFRERIEPVKDPLDDYADASYVEDYVAAYRDVTIIHSEANAVAVLLDTNGELYMVCLRTSGGSLNSVCQSNAAKGPYAKLVRNGDVFTGYCSTDEEAWTEIGQVTLSLPERVEMGMAVCSGVPTALAKATFSGFWRIESPSATNQKPREQRTQ